MTYTVDPRVDDYIDALLSANDHVNVFLYDGTIANNRAGGWRKIKREQ